MNKLKILAVTVIATPALLLGIALGFWFDSGNYTEKVKVETKEVRVVKFMFEIGEEVKVFTDGITDTWSDGKVVAVKGIDSWGDEQYVVEYDHKTQTKGEDNLAKKELKGGKD